MATLIWKQLARANDNSDIVTWRVKVNGGWLVSIWAAKPQADAGGKSRIPGGSNWGGGLTFVPGDVWEVDEVP